MKRILFLSCAFFLFATVSNAQSTNTDNSAAPQQHMRMRGGGAMNADFMKKLNLTPDQQTKLKALNEDAKQKRDSIKNDASLTSDQKKQAFKDLGKKNMEDRQAIYTPEQKALIEQSHKDRAAHRGSRTPASSDNSTQGGGQ